MPVKQSASWPPAWLASWGGDGVIARIENKRIAKAVVESRLPTVDISAGYRTPRWEIRADGRNLADRRDPVSESELGESQYYLMTSRRVDLSLRMHF